MLEIILLSITQGITEFLPISSSAHLILISKYFDFNNENLTLDISLHLGSLLAVTFFFKKKIFNFLQNKSLFFKIIIGSLPTMVCGFLLIKLSLIDHFRNTNVIVLTTILFAILLYFSDKSKFNKHMYKDFGTKESLYIGLMQIFSLIPGVSRAGIIITAARFLNFDRVDSAKISFLFSIPTLTAVSLYGIIQIIKLEDLQITVQNYWGIILSFMFSMITLNFFIKLLKKISLLFFVIYRIVLGIIIFLYVYSW